MLSFFPRGVFDEILNLIESVSEGFPSYTSEVDKIPNMLLRSTALSDYDWEKAQRADPSISKVIPLVRNGQ